MMIDRCSNKVRSWSPFRRCLPCSPLVGASFEVVDPPPEISLLSLSSLWMASWYEWLSPCEWRHLQGFMVGDPSGARKGGRTDPQSGLGRPAWADRPRPISARFGHPFAPVGPHAFMHFAPSTCMILTMSSSRPRWRFSVHEVWSFMLQSPGVFLHNTSVLATIGSDFIKLMNTNKTP
jgi:hypothetical protein